MRLFKRAREIFQHKSEDRELRAEVEALRYLVKILLTSMVCGEPRQADQELQELVAATRYVKSRRDDEDTNGTTEQLTEKARTKALEVIESVRSAIMQ